MNKSPREQLFEQFIRDEQLTERQADQFYTYLNLIQEWNKKFNLTTITDVADIIADHFQDSLRLADAVDLSAINSLGDIGAGAGMPGIPLKIKYPHLSLVLIEVNQKKISFLNHVIGVLGLEQVQIYSLDWRTFLRKTNYEVDLFCARASLHPDELVRMFKPSSPYKDAQLIYWASHDWQPGKKEGPFMVDEKKYQIKNKKRRLVFFALK